MTFRIVLAASAALVLAAGAAQAQNMTDKTRDAGHDVARGARHTGHAVARTAREGGHVVAKGARATGHEVAKAGRATGHAVAQTGRDAKKGMEGDRAH